MNIAKPEKIHINELMRRNREAMGLEPLPLETETLLERIKKGDWSAEYLADAFLSTYGMRPFNRSLHQLINLDAQGFRLFHQILHMRHVTGWDDEELYETACAIKQIIK